MRPRRSPSHRGKSQTTPRGAAHVSRATLCGAMRDAAPDQAPAARAQCPLATGASRFGPLRRGGWIGCARISSRSTMPTSCPCRLTRAPALIEGLLFCIYVLRGAHIFVRRKHFDPCRLVLGPAPFDPRQPRWRDDADQVGQVLLSNSPALRDADKAEPPGLAHRIPYCGARASGLGGDPIDDKIAHTVVLHLPDDHHQGRTLAFRERSPDLRRRNPAASHLAPARSRSGLVRRALPAARREQAERARPAQGDTDLAPVT